MGACVYVYSNLPQSLENRSSYLLSLNGIGSGPAETIQPTIVADIMFLHERGRYNTLYFVSYFGSLMVGPIISGPMAEYLGWRSFWWFNAGVLGFVTLACIFLFPETRYSRAFEQAQSPVSSSPLKSSMEQLEAKNLQTGENVKPTSHDPELAISQSTSLPNAELEPVITKLQFHQDPWLHRGRPSKQQWAFFQPRESTLLREFLLPWQIIRFPIILFASFAVSFSASAFLTINLTQSQAFAAPPYNYNSQTIGFLNFAILIGAFIGLFTAGPLSDTIAARLTKRNGGVREPEMRLLAMVPYVGIMIIGNVVLAIGYDRRWDWKVFISSLLSNLFLANSPPKISIKN